jgi:perosamine synthetase
MIPFFDISLSKKSIEAASYALQNEKLVLGESVFKFEEEFSKFIGTKYAVSTNSGNASLHLSLIALGLNHNHKIATSTNSFIASANCIRMINAKPILSDIYSSDGSMDINSIQEKPDALIPVHIYGNPCKFDEIKSYSEENKIPIIEDAAQAHGATFKNKKIGSLGDVGCFSFYTTKNMTVGGDGGMITTNNEEIATMARSLRDNGRSNDRNEHDKLGFTMRLNTVNAAIGRVQLKELEKNNQKRQNHALLYKKFLEKNYFLEENSDGMSVYHQIVFKHHNRDKILEHLTKNEIHTAIHYPIPIHKQPFYKSYSYNLPESEKFAKEIFSLPSFPELPDESIKIICEKINEVIN